MPREFLSVERARNASALTIADVPHDGGGILAAGQQSAAVGRKLEGANPAAVTGERRQLLAGRQVPETRKCVGTPACRQDAAVRGERQELRSGPARGFARIAE